MEYESRKNAKYGIFFHFQINSSWLFGEVIRRVASVQGVGLYSDVEASKTRIQ
jgi:hypothetical protein